MKKIILFIALGLISCDEYSNRYDFRNYLRDKHPYSKIVQIKEFSSWDYRVTDTIKNEDWIYLGSKQKSQVSRYLIKPSVKSD